jgi:hypothetical protein
MKPKKNGMMTKGEIEFQADRLNDLPLADQEAEQTKAGAGTYGRGIYQVALSDGSVRP